MPSVPGMGRKTVKKDDVRLAHAHLTRMLANNLLPSSLPDNVVSMAVPALSLQQGCPAVEWEEHFEGCRPALPACMLIY